MNFDTKLQMLVDGELPHADRSQLLLQIESQPSEVAIERWKQVALAFVEQQIINESFSGQSFSGQSFSEQMPNALPAEKSSSTLVAPAKLTTNQSRLLSLFAALALGLLLAGLLGYLLGNSRGELNPRDSVADARDQPIVEVNAELSLADAIARSARPIPPSFRREMLKAGYLVNENLETTSVDLPVGGTIDIPIRRIDIEFLGIAAFQ